MNRTSTHATGTRPGATACALTVTPAAGGVAITGPVPDVAALLAHLNATGATVTPSPGRDRIHLTLPAATTSRPSGRSRVRAAAARVRWPHLRTVLVVLLAISGAAAVAGIAVAVWLAVAWLIAHLAVIGAVLLALAVLAAVAGVTGCTTTVRITHHH